jgi:1,4-dihydroxy-6-naphthoate synthase
MKEITIAHSPDSDDAFMFYALANDIFDTEGLQFYHVLKDIETLNKAAFNGVYEVSAISIHAYPQLADKYILLPTGSSMGDQFGPMIVSDEDFSIDDLNNLTIAVPGELTTALLAMRLFNPQLKYEVVPFDQIIPSIKAGKYKAGLIIHEGQLTYASEGLYKIIDMGQWWYEDTGLPLPLGGNVIRRDLGNDLMYKVSDFIKRSIQYSLDNREPALKYALQYAGDMDPKLADKFVGMYVNHWTIDYGDRGRKAIKTLLTRGFEAGIIDKKIEVEFLD